MTWGPPRTPMVTSTIGAQRRRDGRYSTSEIVRITGATYRQLDYWARMGYVPGQPAGTNFGSGIPRRWTDDDIRRVQLLRVASALRHGTLTQVVAWLEHFGLIEDIEAAFVALGPISEHSPRELDQPA